MQPRIDPVAGYDSRIPALPRVKEAPFKPGALPRVKPRARKRPVLDGENEPVRAENAELPKRQSVKLLPTTRYPRRPTTGGPTMPRPKVPVLT